MAKTSTIVLQQAFSCVACFIFILASLVAIIIRFSLFDALRLSFDPVVSIMLTYFLGIMPVIYISFLLGRMFYRAIVLTLVGIAAFAISTIPRMAL